MGEGEWVERKYFCENAPIKPPHPMMLQLITSHAISTILAATHKNVIHQYFILPRPAPLMKEAAPKGVRTQRFGNLCPECLRWEKKSIFDVNTELSFTVLNLAK